MTNVSLSEFAKSAGISPPMVTKLIRQGVLNDAIVKQKGKKRIKLNLERARELYRKGVDPAFKKGAPSIKNEDVSEAIRGKSGDQSFIEARTWAERYKAAERKLNFEIKQNKWMLKSEARDEAFNAARVARDTLLNMPARVAAIVAADTDESSVYQILYKELREVIDEFIRQLAAIGD